LKRSEQFVVIDGERWYANNIDGNSFLDLRDFNIKTLKEVVGLEHIIEIDNLRLDLSFNELVDTSGLEDVVGLQALKLRGNKIIDIKGLDKLTNLEELDLNHN
jgi:Leucine-rich repeat (LRR) protein